MFRAIPIIYLLKVSSHKRSNRICEHRDSMKPNPATQTTSTDVFLLFYLLFTHPRLSNRPSRSDRLLNAVTATISIGNFEQNPLTGTISRNSAHEGGFLGVEWLRRATRMGTTQREMDSRHRYRDDISTADETKVFTVLDVRNLCHGLNGGSNRITEDISGREGQ